MSSSGKRYRQLHEQVDRTRDYAPGRGDLDASSRCRRPSSTRRSRPHIRLGVNVRHADQQVRGTMVAAPRPRQDVTVAVFAQGDKAREAEAAGADAVGGDDLAERVSGGWTDFDVAIATPDMMPVVAKLGRDARPAGQDAEPEGRDRHRRRRPRGRAGQGRPGRVPHRPHRDHPHGDRQGRLRRARACSRTTPR